MREYSISTVNERALRATIVPRWLALAVLSGACSSGDPVDTKAMTPDESAAGAAADVKVSCTMDPRVSPVATGLVAMGRKGVSVTLDSGEPNFPAIGDNTWSVTVLSAAGEPLVGAALAPSAKMPDHGHMSPTTPSATLTDDEGRATISGLNLFMAGVWRIELAVTAAGEAAPSDSVSFSFCVEG
jgi:hypothetical protein